jgi:hypothetical protein
MDEIERLIDEYVLAIMNRSVFVQENFRYYKEYERFVEENFDTLVHQCAAYLRLDPETVSIHLGFAATAKMIMFNPGRMN